MYVTANNLSHSINPTIIYGPISLNYVFLLYLIQLDSEDPLCKNNINLFYSQETLDSLNHLQQQGVHFLNYKNLP